MASLHIRNVPESVRRGLRLRAARKGRSMEAEVRAILAESVKGETGQVFDPAALQGFIRGLFRGKPPRLTDELIRERRREARKESHFDAQTPLGTRSKRAGARQK